MCECGSIINVPTSNLNNGHTKSCGCTRYKTPKDLSGVKFGKLTVLYKSNNKPKNGSLWVCRCECGKEVEALRGNLVNGDTTSCGCIKGRERFTDMSGLRFGRLLIDGYIGRDKWDRILWRCICDCGNVVYQTITILKSERAISCGCYRIEQISGKNNPNWNIHLTEEERLEKRNYKEYREWRNLVFERDDFKCFICGGGNGELNAHHIFSHNKYRNLRLCVPNGVTLCETCHNNFHIVYKKGNNDLLQFANFLITSFSIKLNQQIEDELVSCLDTVNASNITILTKKVDKNFGIINKIISEIKNIYLRKERCNE